MTRGISRSFARLLAALCFTAVLAVPAIPAAADAPSSAPTDPSTTQPAVGSSSETPAAGSPSASGPVVSGSPSAAPIPAGSPTSGQLLAALAALAAGTVLGGMVVSLVRKVHESQAGLARRVLSHGGDVTTRSASAAYGDESRLAENEVDAAEDPNAGGTTTQQPQAAVTGPAALTVGTPVDFIATGGDPATMTWTVEGLSSYSRASSEPRKLRLTPNATGTGEVTLSTGSDVVRHPITVGAAPPAGGGFQMQLVIRNWGLIVVAIGIVFGAVALGLAGVLDGASFIALVAPLAALLGVTAAAGRGGSGGGDGS